MKIGILGGTFDPIHRVHLKLAHAAKDHFNLDRVLVMPTGNSYLKTAVGEVTSSRHRQAMVKLALEGEEDLVFSDLELNRPGYTYTSDTLRTLSERYPGVTWYFIIGADSLHGIADWHEPEVIFSLADVIAANRDYQVENAVLREDKRRLQAQFGARIHRMDFDGQGISSSGIRKEIADGRLPHPALAPAVNRYIADHGLYKKPKSEEEICAWLKAELKPGRYQHTLRVAQTAEKMAEHYGSVPPGKAYLAGILHDCGKSRGTALTHGPIGAEITEREFGIHDEDILNAVRNHTTGRPGMSDLEKILFIADYIEPGRNRAPHLDELRELAYRDMDETIIRILKDTLDYLKESASVIDEKSLDTYNYYTK